jgi:hypothetical protein
MWDQVVSRLSSLEAQRQALLAQERERQAQVGAFEAWANSASRATIGVIRSTLELRIPEVARATGSMVRLSPLASKSTSRFGYGVEAFGVTIDPCTVHVYAARTTGELPRVHLCAMVRRGGRQEAVVSQPACIVVPTELGFELQADGVAVSHESIALRALSLLIDACQARLRRHLIG